MVDAADYFAAVADAIEAAERSVYVIGWDVQSRVRLRRDGREPSELRDVLDAAATHRPGLEIRVLVWDYSLIYAFERELLPALQLEAATHHRVRCRSTSEHPPGGSLHQKVVVVDDRLAFAGGIDLSIARWDRRAHDPDEPERRQPDGERYAPFHDVQVAVDGAAARALGQLARHRWYRATQEQPPPAVTTTPDPWPSWLPPHLEEVDVGIVTTVPEHDGEPGRQEVRQLYLDAIAGAQQSIYIENQYLTATCIRDALARRLEEEDGPEVVIVTPRGQSGRLEELTMGALRTRWLDHLRRADRHDRLAVLYPVARIEPELPITVHAKVMIVDDELLRVASSNMSNRSMGLDYECDVAVVARGDSRVREAITRIRDGLIAEHLRLPVGEVETTLADSETLLSGLDAFLGETSHLRPLEWETATPPISDELIDPDEPLDEAIAQYVLPGRLRRVAARRLPRLIALVLVLLGLAALWTWGPAAGWVEPQRVAEITGPLERGPWGPVLFAVGMAVATLFMAPVTALTVAAGLLFGPWLGAVVAFGGSLTSAAAGYAGGRLLLKDTVRALAGKHLEGLSRALGRHGILSVIAVRVIPVAPYTIVNVVAGSSQVRFRHYLVGTALGMAPGTVVLTVAADRVAAAVLSPTPLTILVAVLVVGALAATLYALRRWMSATTGRTDAPE